MQARNNLVICDFLSAAALNDKLLLRNAFRLRQQQFKERDQYNVPSWQGMEFDEYDNLAAAYLIWRADHGSVLGFARLTPTVINDRRHSMIADHWPGAVSLNLPSGNNVYEGSRFVVAQELSANPILRTKVIDELVLGIMEFGLAVGAEHIIGTMYRKVWNNVFVKRGWDVEFLGEEVDVGEARPELITVGQKKVSQEIYRNMQETMGIKGPVADIVEDMLLGHNGLPVKLSRKVS